MCESNVNYGSPKQKFLKRTGHRSEDVRKYKDCTSSMLKKVFKALDPPRRSVKMSLKYKENEPSKHFHSKGKSCDSKSRCKEIRNKTETIKRDPLKDITFMPTVFNMCNFTFS